jgi:hypothetical protein
VIKFKKLNTVVSDKVQEVVSETVTSLLPLPEDFKKVGIGVG